MASTDYEFDDIDLAPEGSVTCPNCSGGGWVTCRCGGDFCVCGDEEADCPTCDTDGYVSRERADRYERNLAKQREMLREFLSRQHKEGS